MTGYVYAIADGAGLVKLGWSAKPEIRFNKVKADNGGDCSLVGCVPATLAQEHELHGLLEPWRVRGEWFRIEGPVAYFVETVRNHFPPKNGRKVHDHPIARYRNKHGLTLDQFAALVGRSRSLVCKYENGYRKGMSFALAKSIVSATNGEITIEDLMRADGA